MFKEYFEYSRNERNGIIVLFALILFVIALPSLYERFKPSGNNKIDYEALAPLLAEWERLKPQPIDTILFAFNPNTASKDNFLQLGLSPKVAQNIVNYRNKGGKFYKKEDFKKIWDLAETDYARLLPYLQIDDSNGSRYENYNDDKPSSPSESFPFDPNTASEAEFVRLGLSPKLAATINKYRSKGGKFYKKEDFKKMWGLQERDYLRLAPFITLSNNNQNQANDAAATPSELFNFDPNTATITELTRLGLSPKLAEQVINYRNKGGNFYKKEDFKKMWGLSESDYERLAPFISIEKNIPSAADIPTAYNNDSRPKKSKTAKVDINAATAADWQVLSGIGEKLSARIVQYRTQLGGFIDIDQVKTIYGLPEETFQQIKPQLTLTTKSIQKINLNTATEAQLKAHPYIKWKEANLIVAYRKQHGAYKQVSDILKIKVFKQDFYNQITPYLTVE